jgi:hypothetical protein
MRGSTYTVVAAIIICILVFYLFTNSFGFPKPALEGMGNLQPGLAITDHPDVLLSCDYPIKANPGVSEETPSTLWKYRPVLPINSLMSNNIRYWATPNNGGCIPTDMCNGLYDKKTINIPDAPPMLGWGKETRVNYYAANPN